MIILGGTSTTLGQIFYLTGFTGASSNYSSFKSAGGAANGASAALGVLYIAQLAHAWFSSQSTGQGKVTAGPRWDIVVSPPSVGKERVASGGRMEIRYGFRF